MKTNQIIHVCGSIVKKESLIPIDSHIMPNTSVAEANLPYFSYYGLHPENTAPNSIFLFTHFFYSLEEVLRFAQNTEICVLRDVNVASAVLNFSTKQVPAIRIKNFPDYEHLVELQKCFLKHGVVFEKKFAFEKEAFIQIKKCFVLEEIKDGILLDKKDIHEGYIQLPKLISNDSFTELMQQIRNNGNCKLFDAAKASLIINSKLTDIIRIYSEKLDIKLLECIKENIDKELMRKSSFYYFNAS